MSIRTKQVLTTLKNKLYTEYEVLSEFVSQMQGNQELFLSDPSNPQKLADALTKISGIEVVSGFVENSLKDIAQEAEFDVSVYDTMKISDLAAALKALKDELDIAGKEKTEIQKRYDHLSISVLPDRMEEEGIESMKVPDVGRLQVSSDIQCSVPADNRESVQNWLREHGHEAMIAENINASTFKAFIKEQMKAGNEYPKDLIKIHPFSRANVVKA